MRKQHPWRRRETRRPALFALVVQLLLLSLLLGVLSGQSSADEPPLPQAESFPVGAVDENNVFIPTDEWQRVPEGAEIPGGLWVRMDLSGGGRFARLLDKEAEMAAKGKKADVLQVTQTAVAVIEESPVELPPPLPAASSQGAPQTLSPRATMEKVLHNLPEEEIMRIGVDLRQKKKELSEDAYWSLVESVWNDRQDLMSRVYAQMMKPDEVLNKFISTLRMGLDTTEEEMNQVLVSLEDHLSDIDMSRDFHTMGGWPHLAALLDNQFPISVRTNAAWVIGNAVKNDQEFQGWMLEDGAGVIPAGVAAAPDSALARLLAILSGASVSLHPDMSQMTSDEALEAAKKLVEVDGMLRKVVYALTSATRGNVELQEHLVAAGAMETLSRLVADEGASRPLRVKVASFLYDLLMEAEHHGQGRGKEVFTAVKETAWCPGLERLMGKVQADPVELEQVLLATSMILPHCGYGGEGPQPFVMALQTAAKVYDSGEGGTGVAINAVYRDEIKASIRTLLSQAAAVGGSPASMGGEL